MTESIPPPGDTVVVPPPRRSRESRRRLNRLAYHAIGLFPLAWLLFDFWFGFLGPEPIRAMILRMGKAAIILLTLSLACSPAGYIFGWKDAVNWRRALGLYAFLYVCLHLLFFVWLDYGFMMRLVIEEIVLRRYAVVGFLAFLLLIPLAVTSTRSAQRRLGKRWAVLHQLVYVAAVLAVIHYIWLVKNTTLQPLLFAAAVGVLLVLRAEPVKRYLLNMRRRFENKRKAAAARRGD